MVKGSNTNENPFADVLSVDGWFMKTEKEDELSLHADVVFGQGRIGGENASPVRFKLAIKRANLVIVLMATEPMSILKETVSRDGPSIEGKRTTEEATGSKNLVAGSASLKSEGGSVKPFVSGSLESNIGHENREQLIATEKVLGISVKQTINATGDYKWELLPGIGAILNGRPWDAAKIPRMILKDHRTQNNKQLPVTVRLEVSCLREDLEITEIQLKSKKNFADFLASPFKENKLVAAEAYIRNNIIENGLGDIDISEPFAAMTLAIKVVES
jgi:hypothetical protein